MIVNMSQAGSTSRGLTQMLQTNSSFSDFMRDLKGDLLMQIKDEAAPKANTTSNDEKVDVPSGQTSSDGSQNTEKQENSADGESVLLQDVETVRDTMKQIEQNRDSVDSKLGYDQTSTHIDMQDMQERIVSSREVDIKSVLPHNQDSFKETSDDVQTSDKKENSNIDQESTNEQDTSSSQEVSTEEDVPSQNHGQGILQKVSSFPLDNLEENYDDVDDEHDLNADAPSQGQGQRVLQKVLSFPLDDLNKDCNDVENGNDDGNPVADIPFLGCDQRVLQKISSFPLNDLNDDNECDESNPTVDNGDEKQGLLNREISFEEFEGIPQICFGEEDQVSGRQLTKVSSHRIAFDEQDDEHDLEDDVVWASLDNADSSSHGSNEVEVEVSQGVAQCL